jgi:Uma2 family endonuclease
VVVTLGLPPFLAMSAERFFDFCGHHPELRIERNATGEIIVMAAADSNTGRRNALLTQRLQNWVELHGGVAFASSAGFTLPNGAQRSPDASWVQTERWQALSARERDSFAPLCPDLVVELTSPSDRRATVRPKMQEYLDNGARLGWLIDPTSGEVEVWRPGLPCEVLVSPTSLSGETVLPGLELSLTGTL